MTARLSNNGYLMLGKETTPGVTVAPTIAVPLYDETIDTDQNIQDIGPAEGVKFATIASLPGVRSHKGDVTVMFEPNTAAHFVNMLMTQGTSTNAAGVYTWPYTLGSDSASYTIEVSLGGNIVKRISGVKSDKFAPSLNKNEWQLKVGVAGLSSFDARDIVSVTGTGPYTIVLSDPNGIFDGNPTKGLLANDAISFYDVSAQAYINGTVTAVTNGTTFTCTAVGALTAIVAGDQVQLRPQTPAYNNLAPFLWSKTRFYFGASASAALANATHTPVESGSTVEIDHKFADANGSMRSGSFDPASLDRTIGDVNLTIKKLCDTPEDLSAYKGLAKTACVVRMYAGSTNQYEFRLTYNHLIMESPLGNLKAGDLVYTTEKYHTMYSQTDGQAFDVKVLNTLTTV